MKAETPVFPINGTDTYKYSIVYQDHDEDSQDANLYSDQKFLVQDEIGEIADIIREAHYEYGVYAPVASGVWESNTPNDNHKYVILALTNKNGEPITQEEHDFITALMNNGKISKDDTWYGDSENDTHALGGFVIGGLLGAFLGYHMGRKSTAPHYEEGGETLSIQDTGRFHGNTPIITANIGSGKWIRVDNDLWYIKSVDINTGDVTIQRSYDNEIRVLKRSEAEGLEFVHALGGESQGMEEEVYTKMESEGNSAKYKIGDKVYYLPKLSGFNNSKPLVVSNVSFKQYDQLEKDFGLSDKPHYHYSFENSNLGAKESDLSDSKPTYSDGGEIDKTRIAEISRNTSVRESAIEDFVKKHNINLVELNIAIAKGDLNYRMDFATAVSGKPDNKYERQFVKEFGSTYAVGGVIELPNTNLQLVSHGRDSNGNRTVQVQLPNDRAFSIQTNGNLPKTHSILTGIKISDLKEDDILVIEKEVSDYIQEFGSEKQKNKLKVYYKKGGEAQAGKKNEYGEIIPSPRLKKGDKVTFEGNEIILDEPKYFAYMNEWVFKLEGRNEVVTEGELLGEYSKGGNIEEDVYILYLNKDKNFQQDKKEFKGVNAYEDAVSWGQDNLDNFNHDMIKYSFSGGGAVDMYIVKNDNNSYEIRNRSNDIPSATGNVEFIAKYISENGWDGMYSHLDHSNLLKMVEEKSKGGKDEPIAIKSESVILANGGQILKDFNDLKKGDKIKIKYGSSINNNNEANLLVKSKNLVKNGTVEKVTFQNIDNPTGVKFYAYKRGTDYVGFAKGDMGISGVEIVEKFEQGGSLDKTIELDSYVVSSNEKGETSRISFKYKQQPSKTQVLKDLKSLIKSKSLNFNPVLIITYIYIDAETSGSVAHLYVEHGIKDYDTQLKEGYYDEVKDTRKVYNLKPSETLALGGEVISHQGEFLTITATKDRMIIKPTEEGLEEIQSLKEDGKSDNEIFMEFMEDISSNSELEYHTDLGELGFALTSASGITDGYYYDDEGEFTDKGNTDSRVYYFPDYMLRSEVEDFIDRGQVIYHGAENKYEGGGEIRLNPQQKKSIRSITFDLNGSDNNRRNEVIRQRVGSKYYNSGIAYADSLLKEGGQINNPEDLFSSDVAYMEAEEWMANAVIELRDTEDMTDLVVTNILSDTQIEVGNDEMEFTVFKDQETAKSYATEYVLESLEENPENFTQGWLMDFIDKEKAESFFREMYNEWDTAYATDIMVEDGQDYENRLVDEMVERGLMSTEEAESDEASEIAENRIEQFAESRTDEAIEEGNYGFDYYKSNFGDEEAADMLKNNQLIDFDSASEDAVRVDGVAHFLSGYDGVQIDLPSDAVAYRTN